MLRKYRRKGEEMTEEEKEVLQRAEEIKKKEATKAKSKRTKFRKGLFTKILIVLIFTYLFYFTEKVLGIFQTTGVEPTVLITSVFAILGLECGVMGWIKNTKVKKGE